jgi:DNA-binding MurR/RpiR family transcriptional regulator
MARKLQDGADREIVPPIDTRADIISIIKQLEPNLRPSEQRVARAILADVSFAVHSTSGELARRANVSEPTVTRFSRAVGCTGLRDLKFKLAQSLVVGRTYLEQPPHMGAERAKPTLWNTVFDHIHQAVSAASNQLHSADIDKGAEAIANCRRLFAFGVGGGSTLAAEEVKHRFFRLGIAVSNYSDPQLMRMVAATLTRDDVVIAISNTGRSVEVNQAAGIARQYGAMIIAITRADTPLAKLADLPLLLHVPEALDALKPTASRYAFFAAIDLLAASTAYRKPKETQEQMRRMKYVLANLGHGQPDGPLGD